MIAVLLLTAVSCDDGSGEVVLGDVEHADVQEAVSAPAAVAATAAATLTAAADGTLAELRVAPGDEVTSGEVVAVVDSPDAERRLERADEALAAADQAVRDAGIGTGGGDLVTTRTATDEAAEAAFEQARQAADHIADEDLREALHAQVDLAEEQYDTASAAAREAVDAVQRGVASLDSAVTALATTQQLQAQQAYDLAEATVDALTLRAPLDGVVQLGGTAGGDPAGGLGDLLGAAGGLPEPVAPEGAGPAGPQQQPGVATTLAPGALVSAGTPVLTVVDVSELVLVAEVDETDILLVEPGVRAEVELDAAPGARYPATVTAVDVLPSPSPRGGVAYGVHLSLSSGAWPDGRDAPPPRPGMSAVAHLQVRRAEQALAVPAAAVLRVGDRDVVWVVRDGRATRTPVTLGVQGPDLVQVTSGLEAGDRVVVRGADRVAEGDRLP